jgi:hypothetical protein
VVFRPTAGLRPAAGFLYEAPQPGGVIPTATDLDHLAVHDDAFFRGDLPDGQGELGNAGRLPWPMSRETLRRQVPEAM